MQHPHSNPETYESEASPVHRSHRIKTYLQQSVIHERFIPHILEEMYVKILEAYSNKRTHD